MNAFKLRRFHALVILQCVRWYSKYAISYRQLEEMMAVRGSRGRSHDHLAVDSALRPAAGEGGSLVPGLHRRLAGRRECIRVDWFLSWL
jgi:hypothetical protein